MSSDEPATEDASKSAELSSGAELKYESNPKHRDPWQPGKKGSLCEPEVRSFAEQLLKESVLYGDKRYAVYKGKAYCAQQHGPNLWHGYPVGWQEVPSKLALQMETR